MIFCLVTHKYGTRRHFKSESEIVESGFSQLTRSTSVYQCNKIEAIRRRLSPDTEVEVPASWDEYERVKELLENEYIKYIPSVLYDSARQSAIIKAAPSALHSTMAGCILTSIRAEAVQLHQMARNLVQKAEETSTRSTAHGHTSRLYDGALTYLDGNKQTLMIAVEIAVSQNYDSLRAASSYDVCALRCRLRIAMLIKEGRRGRRPPTRHYGSDQEVQAAVEDAENTFSDQLVQRPCGPLVWDGITWFGNVQQVELETYRCQGDDPEIRPDTVLSPSQSFVIVRNGQYVGDSMPGNLRELVLGDCIPTHILSSEEVGTTPVNFFTRDWFEANFRTALNSTAVQRIWGKSEVRTPH
ncbi:hypothetical protein V1525DRAFT_343887 [Lipomyces kononenkoae]|uniref:Uncharacterized protein n=1 Tax=Lipomyces kononenkoae TaxID=34357 RepID=A0ACC3T1M5_LIPKO